MNEFVISSGHCLKVQGASDIINEVNEARKVVNKVYEYLKELNCTVYKFHDDTSTTQSKNLSTIVNYHNSKKRDLDISVHFNAASRTNNPRGVEVLYVSDNSKQIAEKVVNAIAKASGLKNRGIKYRDNLYFLNKTNKPAILIEVCFVDSKADVNVYHNKFNEICKAIAETLSGKKLSETKVTVAKPKEETKVKQQPKSVAKPKYPNKLYKVTSPLMHDSNVKLIQEALNKYFGKKVVTVDGYYGNQTANTVRLFQGKKGLTKDGIVGKNTWNKLF